MLSFNLDVLPKVNLVGFVSYKNPWIHFRRTTDEYLLYIIQSGELAIKEAEKIYHLKGGDVLLLEPGKEHVGLGKHVCDYYYIHFTHSDISGISTTDDEAYTLSPWKDGPLQLENHNRYPFQKCYHLPTTHHQNHIFQLLNDMRQLYLQKNYNRGLTSLKLSEVFIRLSQYHTFSEDEKKSTSHMKAFRKVHDLLNYVHTNYNQKITSTDIEEQFNCNYDYINRQFKLVTGYTIIQYVNQIRIDHAKELLEVTNIDIGEIGYLTGFNDPYYFSKVFKKIEGISPSKWSRRVMKSGSPLHF